MHLYASICILHPYASSISTSPMGQVSCIIISCWNAEMLSILAYQKDHLNRNGTTYQYWTNSRGQQSTTLSSRLSTGFASGAGMGRAVAVPWSSKRTQVSLSKNSLRLLHLKTIENQHLSYLSSSIIKIIYISCLFLLNFHIWRAFFEGQWGRFKGAFQLWEMLLSNILENLIQNIGDIWDSKDLIRGLYLARY